jgi:hypothetical protein
MEKHTTFADVLEAADALSIDEQETLVEILRRRVTELRRCELAKDIAAAREEFQSGGCRPAKPDELVGEILK